MKFLETLKSKYNILIEEGLVREDISWIDKLYTTAVGTICCGSLNILKFINNSPKYKSLRYNTFLDILELNGEELDIYSLQTDLLHVLDTYHGLSTVLKWIRGGEIQDRVYIPPVEERYKNDLYRALSEKLDRDLTAPEDEHIYWEKEDVKKYLKDRGMKCDWKTINRWMNENLFKCRGYVTRDYLAFYSYDFNF